MRALLGVLVLAGCYDPSPANAVLRCSEDKKCPSGYTCAGDVLCYRRGEAPDLAMVLNAYDKCSASLPVHASSGDTFAVDTTNFTDDFGQLMGCTPRNQPGNDGFFALDMNAKERWHFHIRIPMGSADADPSVYVLPNCDDRACKRIASADECGPGYDEHLTFVPDTAGRYIVAVDSPAPGGAAWAVLAIHPVCGNMTKEHSESCDDGNTNSGDGCSAMCATELADGQMEVEPNDDAVGANPLAIPGITGAITVKGQLRNGCDPDMFVVQVPANGSVAAAITDNDGNGCASGAQLQLHFVGSDGFTLLGMGAASPPPCPAIGSNAKFAQMLPQGIYYLRVQQVSRDKSAPVNYRVKVEVR